MKTVEEWISETALEFFNDPYALDHWVVARIPAMDWKKPIDLLGTQEGRDEVRNVLLCAFHGVYQ